MSRHGLSQTQELQEAFHQFNQVSEKLSSSYHDLESRVGELSEELVTIQNNRLIQLNKKERMANRLESLLDTLPAGVVVLNGDGFIQQCNPAAVDLLGTPLLNALWRDVIKRAFIPGTNGEDITLRNGRVVSLATCPLNGEAGQILLLMDVTETRSLQNMVHRYQRLSSMGEMVASLAHQIRTPLSSSLLYASQLQSTDISSDKKQHYAGKIIERLKYLERMIEDMLVFVRGGRTGQDKITVSALLDDVKQIMEPQLLGYDCAFEVINEADHLEFCGNRDAISGVLQNLVTNAVQACLAKKDMLSKEYKSIVRLVARKSEENNHKNTIEFLVIDNGSGITSEVKQKIFEPFFTTKSQGTGLGLAVVQAIIHAHDGAIWVDSEPQEGTTFGVRFPVARSERENDVNTNNNVIEQGVLR